MRIHSPSPAQPDLSDLTSEIGCLQLNWLLARSAKVYFELLVERYNPQPNSFDWSLNCNPESQCKNLRRYRKGGRKPPVAYWKIRATKRNAAKLPRSIPAREPLVLSAIS